MRITNYQLRVIVEKRNVVKEKSYAFAVEIINLYKYLVFHKKEYIIAKQLLRCGTSIGANIEEALGGQSKKDFLNKISIAYKEARETHYWLRLLKDTEYYSEEQFNTYSDNITELIRIITAIKKKTEKDINS